MKPLFGRKLPRKLHREEFISKILSPAILGETCSICLRGLEDRSAAVLTWCKHAYCVGCIRKWSNLKRTCPLCNAQFDSWFSNIDLCRRRFQKERLPSLNCDHKLNRIVRSTRNGFNSVRRREISSPWRRSFGRTESLTDDVIAQRKLRWRASIYEQRIQAIPSSVRDSRATELKIESHGAKEKILHTIEPWIHRELRAILGDANPSIIRHVVMALFIARLEVPSTQLNAQDEDDFLSPLRRFLHDRTDLFWHELRCFAGCSYNMETYDQVVQYRTMD